MEDREGVRAVFSTANGKYAYREARHWVRAIFREDFCSQDDAEDMAQRLRCEFPQDCKVMTSADAWQVENYFDAVDIQMQSRLFLHEVLMHIVRCNFEQARERVQEYVNRIFLDPVRYERLTVEDSQSNVFTEEEHDLVGYDNTLPAALAILKQSKFPQTFGGPVGYCSAAPQPLSAVTASSAAEIGQDATTGAGSHTARPIEAHFDDFSHPDPAGALPIKILSETKAHSNEFPSTYGPEPFDGQTIPQPFQLPLRLSKRPKPAMQNHTGPRSLANFHSDPMTNAWLDHSGASRGGSDRFHGPLETMPHPLPHPLPHRQQSAKGPRLSRGIHNPNKKTPDDSRRQNNAVTTQRYLPQFAQARWTPAVPKPSQPPFLPCSGTVPQVPSRMSSIGFGTPFGPGTHRKSSVNAHICGNAVALVPFYPRPESKRSYLEIGELPRQDARNMESSFQPRILSTPFPSTILEDPEREEDDTINKPGMNSNERRVSSQGPCDHPNAFHSNGHERFSGHRLANHMLNECSGNRLPQVSSVSYLGHQFQRPYDHIISPYPVMDTRMAPKGTPSPLVQLRRIDSHDSTQGCPQLGLPVQKENESFPLQPSHRLSVNRKQPQNQHHRHQSSGQYQPRTYQNRRLSLQQEHSRTLRPLPPPDDRILFISGLPAHLDVNALWGMLSPVRGLEWIANPWKGQAEGSFFSSLVFHEPYFATEALQLLPDTLFTAMNGKYLDVRRFDSSRADITRLGTPCLPGWSDSSFDSTWRSSEPMPITYGQNVPSKNVRGHQNHFPASGKGHDDQTISETGQGATKGNGHEGNSHGSRTPEPEQPSANFLPCSSVATNQLSPHCDVTSSTGTAEARRNRSYEESGRHVQTAEGPSSVSTGSPVKRTKWKGTSPPKTPKRKLRDYTKTPTQQLLGNEEKKFKCASQGLVLEAGEASAGGSMHKEQADEGKPLDPIEERTKGLSPDAAKTQAQTLQKFRPQSSELEHQSEEANLDYSCENARASAIQPAVQPTRTQQPLDEAIENRETSVHLPRTPNAITSSNATVERQRAAKASQQKFAAELVQTHLKATLSKQKTKAPRPSAASKATHQQLDVKSGTAEPDEDNEKATQQFYLREREIPIQQEQAAAQILPNDSLKLPTTEAQKPPDSDTKAAANTQTGPSSEDTDKEGFLQSMAISDSAGRGASSVYSKLPITTPTTVHATKCSNCATDQGLSPVADVDPDAYKYVQGFSMTGVGPAHLRSKLEASGTRLKDVRQPAGASTNQGPTIALSNNPNLCQEQPPTRMQEGRKSASTKSRNTSEGSKLSREQQKCENIGSSVQLPAQVFESKNTDMSDGTSAIDPGKVSIGDKEQFRAPLKEFFQKAIDPDITTPIETTGLGILGSGRQSPECYERLAIPPRSSSTAQSSAPAPVITRKKKQKKFPGVAEGQEVAPCPKNSDETEQRSQNTMSPITNEGTYPVAEASRDSFESSQSVKYATRIAEATGNPSKLESENTLALKSASMQSQRFGLLPTNPHPENPPRPELLPVTLPALADDHTGIPNEGSSAKSRNRRKNKPGKKKPKAVGSSSLGLNSSISTLVTENVNTESSPSPVNDQLAISGSSRTLQEAKTYSDTETLAICQSKGEVRNGDDADVLETLLEVRIPADPEDDLEGGIELVRPLHTFSCQRDASDGIEQNSYVETSQGSPAAISAGTTFVQVARDCGYQEASDSLHFEIHVELGMVPIGSDCRSSVVVTELRSRSSKAVMKRIRDLCIHEEQVGHSLCSKVLFPEPSKSQIQSNVANVMKEVGNEVKYNQCNTPTEHVPFDKKRVFGDSNGIECVAALDHELHAVLREAAQRSSSFAIDEENYDLANSKNLESTRAKRILSVATFRENSPLNPDLSLDTDWMSEWCDAVAEWLHRVPRLTEVERKKMYEWEKAHPSMEKNIMSLGFTTLEIEKLGLIWMPEKWSTDPLSVQHVEAPSTSRWNSEPKVCLATEILDTASDPFQNPFEKIEGVKSRLPHIIDSETGQENDEFKDFEDKEPEQGVFRGKGKLTEFEWQFPDYGDDQQPKADTKDSANQEEVLHSLEKKQRKFESRPASQQAATPYSLSPPSRIVEVGREQFAQFLKSEDQLKIEATIKQNEEDLRGKSFARKYKKADRVDLLNLGLTTSAGSATVSTLVIPAAAQPQTSASPSTQKISSSPHAPATSKTSASTSQPKPSKIPVSSTPTSTAASSTSKTPPVPSLSTSAFPPHLPPSIKPSYATALQSPAPKAKEPQETDAWAVRGEEAWGPTTCIAGEGSGGGGSSPRDVGEGNGDSGGSRRKMSGGERE